MDRIYFNTTNKEKFFVQYWGQRVLRPAKNRKLVPCDSFFIADHIQNGWLELNSLANITDEDATKVGDILKLKPESYFQKNLGYSRITKVKQFINDPEHYYIGAGIHFMSAMKYLLSKDYYIGDGQEIKHGWAKIKE